MDVGLPALRVEAGLTFMARVCAPESVFFCLAGHTSEWISGLI